MILSVRINNFLVYSNDVDLSLKADMRIKKFSSNVYHKDKFNVLKAVCIYGANNSGKTCIIRAIASIKNVLLGLPADVSPNMFSDDKTCTFGISFIEGNKAYSYDYKYNSAVENGYKKGFTFECFKELSVDKYGNHSAKELFIRDTENGIFNFSGDEDLSKLLSLVSNDNILIYTINTSKSKILEEYKNILRSFADKIDIIDMNNIPIDKTIKILKNDEKIKDKVVEIIKMADLDIDDYYYLKDSSIAGDDNAPDPRENVLKSVAIDDMFRLASVYKGKAVRSFTYDSTGTKKMAALASFIVDAIYNGRTLVIDELDSSLHFKLTRAIVSLFNNVSNKNAQLIFTAYDATLLDCKNLFRKDQIWFTAKDSEYEYLYSLADFTAGDKKVRSDSDIFEKYNAGILGAIPEPDLISVLLSGVEAD